MNTSAAASALSITPKALRRVLRANDFATSANGYDLTDSDLETLRDILNRKGRATVLATDERTDLDVDAPLNAATLQNYWTTAAYRNAHRAKWSVRLNRLNQAMKDAGVTR